jgi:putative ABC transport system permease protein
VIVLRNLTRNSLRTTITLLGVALAISAFVSLMSVSNAFKGQMGDLIKTYGIDITITSKGAATPTASSISSADYEKLCHVKGVRSAAALVVGPVKSPWNPYFLLFGVSSGESFFTKLGIVDGKPFNPGARELMVGRRAAERYKVKVNDAVFITREESFKATGIYTSSSPVIDGAVIMELEDAKRILRRTGSVNVAFVQVNFGADSQAVVNEINQRFGDLTAVRSGEFVNQLRLINTVDMFVWVITVIAFITSCFMIMNTFIMAVSERTGEIGILRAVGWSAFMVVRLIILESLVLCVAGALLGNLLALGELWCFQKINPEGLGWLVSVSTSFSIFLTSMGLALALGIAGALYPAVRASRFLPADAIRCDG